MFPTPPPGAGCGAQGEPWHNRADSVLGFLWVAATWHGVCDSPKPARGPTPGLSVPRASPFPLAGIAFPTSISVNNCVCHFSPLKSDQDYILKDGDLVKM